MKSVLESAGLGSESANSSPDSNADPAKVGMWVRALSRQCTKMRDEKLC